MEIVFIRHGQAQHNREYELIGEKAYYDIKNKYSSLTEKGINQSLKRSKDEDLKDIQLVLTSSLPRALETTNLIFNSQEVAVIVTDILRENDYEHICNSRRNISEIKNEYPDYEIQYVYGEEDNLENILNLSSERIIAFEKLLNSLYMEGLNKIAIVSHNDFITSFLGLDYKIPNCGRIDLVYRK